MNPTVPYNMGGTPVANPYAQQQPSMGGGSFPGSGPIGAPPSGGIAMPDFSGMGGGVNAGPSQDMTSFLNANTQSAQGQGGPGGPGGMDLASLLGASGGAQGGASGPGGPGGGLGMASLMGAQGGAPGAAGPGGEPQMSQADMDALIQMLSGAGGPGGGGMPGMPAMSGPAGMGTPKGIGGHGAQGSIQIQPDGSAWDMSNGGSGGWLSMLNPSNLFSMKGLAALAAGAAAIGGAIYFLKGRGAKELLTTEKKEVQNFIDSHSGRVDELLKAVEEKSKDKIASLKQGATDALNKVRAPFTETLDTDAKKAINEAVAEKYGKPYALAESVTNENAGSLKASITDAFKEALDKLNEFKTEVAEKAQ